jgi:hypothetical protein
MTDGQQQLESTGRCNVSISSYTARVRKSGIYYIHVVRLLDGWGIQGVLVRLFTMSTVLLWERKLSIKMCDRIFWVFRAILYCCVRRGYGTTVPKYCNNTHEVKRGVQELAGRTGHTYQWFWPSGHWPGMIKFSKRNITCSVGCGLGTESVIRVTDIWEYRHHTGSC